MVHARQDLHERRLAGSVLAHERVDFTTSELKSAVGEGMDSREVLADPIHLDQGLAHGPLIGRARASLCEGMVVHGASCRRPIVCYR